MSRQHRRPELKWEPLLGAVALGLRMGGLIRVIRGLVRYARPALRGQSRWGICS